MRRIRGRIGMTSGRRLTTLIRQERCSCTMLHCDER
jgi:hypothetical protein